jgi:GT2 family glycosyltransferase
MDRQTEHSSAAAIDVVVVTYNSADHVRTCVEQLCADPAIAVTVVDNSSDDGTLETVADLPLSVVARDDNHGFGFACNVGWRSSSARHVVFLNPDSEADARSIRALADRLDGDRRIGALGPRIVDERGRLQLSQRRFPSLLTSLAAAFFVPRVRPTTRFSLDIAGLAAYEEAGSPDWISGACLAVPRDVLEAVGGFDERFFMYYEDMDLCRRIRDIGYDVRYDPTIRVMHVGGASAPRAGLIPVMAKSRLLYARKHGGRKGELSERLAAALHALTHLLLTTQGREGRRGYLQALALCVDGRSTRRADTAAP